VGSATSVNLFALKSIVCPAATLNPALNEGETAKAPVPLTVITSPEASPSVTEPFRFVAPVTVCEPVTARP